MNDYSVADTVGLSTAEPGSALGVPKSLKERIDAMTREEMARVWRFAPIGDPLFQGDTGEYFEKRFRELGGFSPELSKKIGWEKS